MDIAIVGIGCRFPGGVRTPAEFWKLVCEGVDAITDVPAGRFDVDSVFDPDPGKPGKLYTRWGGFLDTVDAFDADFFGISPREARHIDPQQRLLLEVAWEALEDAGQPPDHLAGSGAGVFVGISTNDYGQLQFQPRNAHLIGTHTLAGGGFCIAANRISYFLDLHGPSLAVDTACSSSLTALHLASQSLTRGECDVAIAAGVNVLLSPEVTMGFCKASMLSPEGRCRPFDANASGYVRSEGAGAVVLKPLTAALENRDPIYAVIRATAINQAGRTPGIGVPNAGAQKALLLQALRDADVAPADVQYVEAHGTGTVAGDPREAEAIGAVYARGRPIGDHCLIGSVKGNIGHLEAAAGVAGLIKTALALKHRRIPPSRHFREPSPAIPFDKLRLRVPITVEDWPAPPGRALAGVNSFGFGGANAHAILAEAPPPAGSDFEPDDEKVRILTISARAPGALRELADAYAELLAGGASPPLRDVCYTAALRRSHHEHRLAVVGSSAAEICRHLAEYRTGNDEADVAAGHCVKGLTPKLAFVFSGMGPQWWGMGRQLLRDEPVFRSAVEECDQYLRGFADWSLIEELGKDEPNSRVAEADRSHVANFALQVGLAALWRSWGVVPDAVVGHSSGEMAAVCVAGALPLRDAIWLAYQRGRLQHLTTGSGGMIAAGLAPDEVADVIRGREEQVSLAAINGPTSVTLSGDLKALTEITDVLERQERFWRWLPVRVPYHGPQMDRLREDLLAALAGLDCRPAATPIVSTATGAWADGESFDAGYWWKNVRQPVLFAPAINRLVDDGYHLFVELSPHPVLAPTILECLAERRVDTPIALSTLRRHDDERRTMLRSLATLYALGRPVDWSAVLGTSGDCVRLPTYAWQRERHWFEPAPESGPSPSRAMGRDSGHPLLGRRLRSARPTWESDLGDGRLAYLEDHILAERATFPGAAYVETMLAAARALKGQDRAPVVIEEVQFHRLLPLHDRKERLLQCVVDESGGRIEIHSAATTDDAPWTLHATGRLGQARPNPRAAVVELPTIRARCPIRVALDDFYASVAQWGLRYAGLFRGVVELWQGRGEALGRIALPEDAVLTNDGYWVHPALLDSAFQAFIAALASEGSRSLRGKGPLVLSGVERVASRSPVGSHFWCHASVERVDGDRIDVRIDLIDDAGNVLLTCESLQFKALNERARDGADMMCQEVWELSPRTSWPTSIADVPSPADITRGILPLMDRFAAEAGFGDHYTLVEPTLNAMAARSIRTALTQLGWKGQADDELTEPLAIPPRYRRLLARLIEIARTADEESRFDEADLATRDDVASAVRLVRESGERLRATLRGQEDARGWLVVGEASEALADFYSCTTWGLFYNRAVAEVVGAAAQRWGRKLRILEIGAGTGATTAAILNRVPDAVSEYVFTDVSPFFARRARDRFRPPPNIRFEVLDIEREPTLEESGFDVVVAADVVHATADLNATLQHIRRLLQPGGLLVLLELTRRVPWLDLVFGPLDGWWRFADHQVRPSHPLIGAAQWLQVLEAAGFGDGACLADTPGDGEPVQTIFVAQTPRDADEPAPPSTTERRWLILADQGGVGQKVATGLRARGDRCTLIRPGRSYQQSNLDQVELVPTDVEHWQRLLSDSDVKEGSPFGLIHLWSLDAPPMGDLATSAVMDFQQLASGSIVSLMQATHGGRGLGEVWLVTSGTQEVGPEVGCASPIQGPLWGLGRVLRNEQGSQRCRLVDLSANQSAEELDGLVAEIVARSDENEPELALRGSDRYLRRLRRVSLDAVSSPRVRRQARATDSSFRLEIGSPGALDTLVLREVESGSAKVGEVTIQVRAAGLNFRDVLQALGMMGPDQHRAPMGLECAGIVTACAGTDAFRPGDEVIAVTTGAFASEVRVPANVVFPKPVDLSFVEAATIPVAFATAHLALCQLARITTGERVLIHTASGGVGLAAVQICQRAGATIFATAGTPEKRAYLASIGIEHVMDSRSLAFADEVLEATGGEGVDVVLNSLAGEARAKGLALLRPGGRFIEMAVRDILSDMPLRLRPFDKGLSFFTIGDVIPTERPTVGATLQAVVQDFASGAYKPLPHTDFDLGNAEQAFRLMAQAGHIGKIVLTVREPSYPIEPRDTPVVRPDATYLITGGLGGFGLAVADWLIRRGARHLVLMGRTGAPRNEDVAAFDALMHRDAEIRVMRGDVTEAADLEGILREIRSRMPPLKGVIHAAMTLDDDLLGRLDLARFHAVLAPKVAGSWNLHRHTREDKLDFFVLFSSGSSLIGIPSQGNYAAANAFLDALALHRRALELPGLAVNWGAIAGVGYVARHPALQGRLTWEGIESISADEACAALESAIRHDMSRVAVARIDWDRWSATEAPARLAGARTGSGLAVDATGGNEGPNGLFPRLQKATLPERRVILERHLLRRTANVLEADSERLDLDRSLTDMGLDSLMAVELQSALRRDLGVELPLVEMLGGVTLRNLVVGILEQVSHNGTLS